MRIGELSSVLGISRETLRFFEKKGLVISKRDSRNEYRDYSIWNALGLMECLKLHRLGLTLNDSVRLTHNASLAEYRQALEEHSDALLAEERRLRQIREYIDSDLRALELVEYNIGRFWYERFDEQIVYPVMKAVEAEEYELTTADLDTYSMWNQSVLFKRGLLVLPRSKTSSADSLVWALCTSKRYADEIGIPVTSEMHVLPPRVSLCTLFDIGSKGNLSHSLFSALQERLIEEGRSPVSDDFYGHLLVRTEKEGAFHRYVKLEAPVQFLD